MWWKLWSSVKEILEKILKAPFLRISGIFLEQNREIAREIYLRAPEGIFGEIPERCSGSIPERIFARNYILEEIANWMSEKIFKIIIKNRFRNSKLNLNKIPRAISASFPSGLFWWATKRLLRGIAGGIPGECQKFLKPMKVFWKKKN